MVEDQTRLDDAFHALAHAGRRSMLRRLSSEDLTVGDLAAPLSMSLWAASKHIQVLERAGLVSRRIEGRQHICRLEPAALAPLAQWLQFYELHWNKSIDALQDLLESEHGRTRKGKKR